MNKPALTKRDYEDALLVQSACNLSGVVHSFHRVMERICEDEPFSTDSRNTHPICRLYAEQIAHLTGAGMPSDPNNSYQKASDFVRQKIRQFEAEEEKEKEKQSG